MENSRDGLFDDHDVQVDAKPLLDPRLEPGESILWTGLPDPAVLSRKYLPRSLAGLGFTAFTVIWICMVIHGGHNNWDRGRAVAPFATHNVMIAACTGIWFLPAGLFMLTAPLRARCKAGRTRYMLTDRRAVIIEPRLLRNHEVQNFSRESLTLARCEERSDGSGDIVLMNRKTRFGMSEAVGFLGIENVREVEALLRTVQFLKESPRPAPGSLADPYLDSIPSHSNDSPTYKARKPSRAFLLFIAAAFSIVALYIVVSTIVVGVILVCTPRFRAAVTAGFSLARLGMVASGFLFTIVWLGGVLFFVRWILHTPVEIVVGPNAKLSFRGFLGSVAIPAETINSIKTGGWRDPNRQLVFIRHDKGTLVLVNDFPDFVQLLTTIKTLNPKVDVNGF